MIWRLRHDCHPRSLRLAWETQTQNTLRCTSGGHYLMVAVFLPLRPGLHCRCWLSHAWAAGTEPSPQPLLTSYEALSTHSSEVVLSLAGARLWSGRKERQGNTEPGWGEVIVKRVIPHPCHHTQTDFYRLLQHLPLETYR